MLRNVYIHEINYLIQFRTTLLVTVFLCQIGIFTSAIRDTPNYDGGKLQIPYSNYSYLNPLDTCPKTAHD